jgi:DNA helicase-2/ATP-dependent DNA helicase PcrA
MLTEHFADFSMSQILLSLNDKQQEAVRATHGPVLVMAGAGSGKTRALTHRIAYMVQEKNINPWNILAVTFTNKAATEMKNRIIHLLGSENPDQSLPQVGTFHATCVRILRKNIHLLNYENAFVIYDTADQLILIKRIMEELAINEKQTNPKAILHYISGAKNELIGPEQYHQYAHNYFTEKVAEVYEKYQKALQKNNALDFDDIIMKTVELFQKESKILDQFQEKFQFISVDEYQDTNHAQYILTNLLAQKYRNLCVIGDSDQSIYSFRGANISNILNFEKDYPEAKIILLEQNYRSTKPILDAAHHIIVKNNKRKDKKLWTQREGGEKIKLIGLENERQEGEFIAREILDRLKSYETPDYNDFVVLYRTHAQSRVLEEVFLRHGLPYKIIGGIKFYERKEIKDLLAYLRIIQNPHDSVSLLRIINTPARKIGTKTIETIQHYATTHNLSFFRAMEEIVAAGADLQEGKIDAIQGFLELIKKLQKVNAEFTATGVLKHVLEYTKYKAMVDDHTVEGDARMENIYELIGVASKYDKLEPGLSLNIFLEEVSLIADIDTLDNRNNAVTFMSVHSAKGLEFPVVFLAGLEEGIFPHSRSLLERDELEEERRLLYVAITRAKDKLYLLYAKNRMLYGEFHSNAPSQFLTDIPPYVLEESQERSTLSHKDLTGKPIPLEQNDLVSSFEDGDKVHHQSFGEGVIISIKGGVATVCFKDSKYGIKKLALSVAPLKKVG